MTIRKRGLVDYWLYFAHWVYDMQSLIAGLLALLAAAITIYYLKRQIYQAEALRLEDRQHDILRVLMKHRGGNISHRESVEAINMVPLYFRNFSSIQTSFVSFVSVASRADSSKLRAKKYIELCVSISKEIIGDDVTYADLDFGYFPNSA